MDARQRCERQLTAAARLARLGYWEHDLVGNRLSWSEETCDVFGLPPDERVRPWDEFMQLVHPDDRPLLEEVRGRVGGGEPGYRVAFRGMLPSGGLRHVEAIGEPIEGPHGRIIRVVGAIQVVMDRKAAEGVVRGRERRPRLKELHRQSRNMQALGQLAGGIAHDFNNLLTAITGYAELIAEDLGPFHRSRRDVDEIVLAATSAASLTSQLLAFTRRQMLEPQVLDLEQVLRRMEGLLGRVIGEHITLVMKPSAAGRVTAAPGQIEQVIVNLAVNARDAMSGGGRLLIETADVDLDAAFAAQHPGASTGKHVLITVSDTGTGMDETTRAHLFEPFFTTKPAGRGTGLGLAIVYGIVEQSGGSIFVYSEPGKGSTFKIYLPVATAAEPAAASPDTHALRGTETVLVVEDQSGVLGVMEKTLRRFGYTVIATATGSEAVATARAHAGPVHVMVTDVVLPDGSGREVARQVLGSRPSVRVLYMSGYTEDAIVHHGVLEPGLSFIQKPFTADALVRRIREVLVADRPPRF